MQVIYVFYQLSSHQESRQFVLDQTEVTNIFNHHYTFFHFIHIFLRSIRRWKVSIPPFLQLI
jgi:hypothetical protein